MGEPLCFKDDGSVVTGSLGGDSSSVSSDLSSGVVKVLVRGMLLLL